MDYNANCDAFVDAVTSAVARHIHPHLYKYIITVYFCQCPFMPAKKAALCQITTVVDFGERYYEYEKKRFLL